MEFGVNVDPRHGYAPSDVVQPWSALWIRSVEHWNSDLTPWLQAVRAAQGKNLVVVDADTVKPGSTYTATAKRIKAKYGTLIDALQVGNEPDGQPGGSSWTMTPAKFDALLWAFRSQMPNQFLVAGGLVSGNAGYLKNVNVGRVDAIAVHPYGQRAGDYPGPNWGFGEVGALIDTYRPYGKPIWITEFGGATRAHPGGIFAGEEQRAEYHSKLMLRLHELRLPVACVFCWSDGMVDGFGLVDAAGQAKETYSAFYTAAGILAQADLPPIVSAVPGNIAGYFGSTPLGVIIHSTRSGTGDDEAAEFDRTVRYVQSGAAGLGWHITAGPGRIAIHMSPAAWGWNARSPSIQYLAIEFAQSMLGGPISDATIDAAAYWIKHYAWQVWPNLPMEFPMHSELPAGIADGKTDAFPRGDPAADQFRQKLIARLT